jgi:hypothetical protein
MVTSRGLYMAGRAMSQSPAGAGITPILPPPPPLPSSCPLIEPSRNQLRQEIITPSPSNLVDSILLPTIFSGLVIDQGKEAPKAPNPVKEILCDVNMLRVRKKKMNKHKLRKFRKKMVAFIKKVRMRREIRKEKAFRVELLAQIKEAEKFDAESYVKKVLQTIDSVPKKETLWERRERIRALQRIHRSNVQLIKPIFEDPVP